MSERRVFQFGEQVEGYATPVLNEREIRAGAGLLFVVMFVAIQQAALMGNFTLLKYSATFFLVDILIRVLVSPRYAPFLVLGRLIVRNQTPEYVGAPQQRQEIQRVSRGQLLVLAAFVALVVIAVPLLRENYGRAPSPLFAPPLPAHASVAP